jgi:hypothetical protein
MGRSVEIIKQIDHFLYCFLTKMESDGRLRLMEDESFPISKVPFLVANVIFLRILVRAASICIK